MITGLSTASQLDNSGSDGDGDMGTRIPAGSSVIIGAPAQPMPPATINSIAEAVARTGGVLEAHMPLCLVEGVMAAPSQVLFILLANPSSCDVVVTKLRNPIGEVLTSAHTAAHSRGSASEGGAQCRL
jgi:hypothetical protein